MSVCAKITRFTSNALFYLWPLNWYRRAVAIKLEFWADSFHEGFWACEELAKFFSLKKVRYEKGFIPIFVFSLPRKIELEITVLGSYKNWDPLPKKISDLIEWGKPDLVAYDPEKKEILFAVEETAAVPTGNQALQRCERMYGALRSRIPFWYLLGEYGMHVDGGIRRDSIWPTILAIKLSTIYRTPCVVLHYSDLEHPEDYSFGSGVESLYKALAIKIGSHLGLNKNSDLTPVLSEQYQHMLDFVEAQWKQLVSHIPKKELLDEPGTASKIAQLVTTDTMQDNRLLDFFNWETTTALPGDIFKNIKPGGFIKSDPLILQLEQLVGQRKAYNLSGNAGSRPQNKADIIEWIGQQKKLFTNNRLANIKFALDIKSFPTSNAGRYHVTTAKNVFYLVDSTKDVITALKTAFPRLTGLSIKNDQPAFIYISNSLKPGRIFGDPYTGQLSAFSNIFTKNVLGERTRCSLAYYPHQVHTQLFDSALNFKVNKGITLMRELLDYAIFHGGALVNMKTGKIS